MASNTAAEPTLPTPEDTLSAFVVRARRIAAHSLAQDREKLREQATRWTLTINAEGQLVVVQTLPDEERFESLAARIRPLTLKREPIWYGSVLDALNQLLDRAETSSATLTSELEAVTDLWCNWDTENLMMRGYFTQLAHTEGPDDEPQEVFHATDSQLGAGWFYADVAHADPKGEKAVALQYSLNDRYAAAVSTYSGLALVVLRTLKLLEDLRDSGQLKLPVSAWTTAVTADSGEIQRVPTEAYLAHVGTTIPPLGSAKGPEWEQVTRKTIEHHLGIIRGTAHLRDAQGGELYAVPATSGWRREGRHRVGLDLTLDDQALIHLPSPRVGEEARCTVEFTLHPDSNRSLLHGLRTQQAFHAASHVSFEDESGIEILRVGLQGDFGELPLPDQVALEACRDLVRLEELAGVHFPPLEKPPSLDELVRRRVLRLLLEGNVTFAIPRRLDLDVVIDEWPATVRFQPNGELIESVTVPIPAINVWHSDMKAEQIHPTDANRPVCRVTVPETERFLIWAPDLQADDFEPQAATPVGWGLEHLLPHAG